MTTSIAITTRTAAPTGSPEIHRPGRGATITAWVLQIGLGFAIGSGGVVKLTAGPDRLRDKHCPNRIERQVHGSQVHDHR